MGRGCCWNENCIVDKSLRLGPGPEFRVGKFIVIFSSGAPALYSGVSSGRGCEALAIKGLEEYFDSLDWECKTWNVT